jgi:hypothetical protein
MVGMLGQSSSLSLSSDGAVSHSEALGCSIFSASSVLAGEACALLVEQLSHGFKVLDSRGWLGLLCVSLCCNWLFLNRLGRLVGVYFDYFFLFCFISWSCC